MLKAACRAAFLMVTAIVGMFAAGKAAEEILVQKVSKGGLLYLGVRIMKTTIISVFATVVLMLGSNAIAIGMPVLAKKNGCDSCHDIDKRVVGPSWMEVSRKYKGVKTYSFGGTDYPLEEGLMIKVSKGGSGKWASMPMPANDPNGTNQGEMRALVKFVLGLA